ncbi:MAG: HNH endonuclease signature motif containing protein [candidate division Zixibacteria bacterium]|nr:HNH endonuclease signature motif containing protein [candidate division Zixibacteria bacterium]
MTLVSGKAGVGFNQWVNDRKVGKFNGHLRDNDFERKTIENERERGRIVSVSDKVRKVLWARSGNMCAFCRKELVVDASDRNNESVVGDECHIVSGRPAGPRYDPSVTTNSIDSEENLLLLCRVHHKLVDDQPETYTLEALRDMKASHEKWVRYKLAEEVIIKPVKISRVKTQIPRSLRRLSSGKDVADLISGADTASFDYDELKTPEEVEAVGGFLQAAEDYGDLSGDSEAYYLVQARTNLAMLLKDLEERGFRAYGVRETQQITGGVQSVPSDWFHVVIRVVRIFDAG